MHAPTPGRGCETANRACVAVVAAAAAAVVGVVVVVAWVLLEVEGAPAGNREALQLPGICHCWCGEVGARLSKCVIE